LARLGPPAAGIRPPAAGLTTTQQALQQTGD
jgi:hypothetical protein